MKTYDLTTCPSCGFDRWRALAAGGEALRHCESCGLVFAPEYADPSEIYVDGYLKGETQFGLDVMHPRFQRFLLYAAERRMRLIEQVALPGRLLDVGCGTGEILAVARSRGWQVCGAEPVEESAAYARDERDLDVRTALLEDAGFPERSFDVVSAFHVLEHMVEGAEFLRILTRWVRPGGVVVIEVPNWRSVHRRAFGASAWPGLRPLEHVAHYTPVTLTEAFRRAGLEPLQVRTPGFIWREQDIEQMLGDLGARWATPWVLRARVLSRRAVRDGRIVNVPSALGWQAGNAVQRLFDSLRVGQVVLGMARVPTTSHPAGDTGD